MEDFIRDFNAGLEGVRVEVLGLSTKLCLLKSFFFYLADAVSVACSVNVLNSVPGKNWSNFSNSGDILSFECSKLLPFLSLSPLFSSLTKWSLTTFSILSQN